MKVGIGRGIWIEDRVLTVAHGVAGSSAFPPGPDELPLNGVPVSVVGGRSGYHGSDGRIDPDTSPSLEDDWAALEVDRLSPFAVNALLPGSGRVNPGETLYVVLPAPREPHRIRFVPARVLAADFGPETSVSDRVIIVELYRAQNTDGRSGAFVGRYHTGTDAWEYVGSFAFTANDGVDGRPVHGIVRPPPHIVRWIFEGSTSPSGESEPLRNGTPSS